MSSDIKINTNLFGSLNEIISNPFMLMDNMGNVLSFNKEAGLLFRFDKEKNNIYKELDDSSSEIITGLIDRLGNGPVVQLSNLRLRSGVEFKGNILLNSYVGNNENYILFIFKRSELAAASPLSEIKIRNIAFSEIVHNPDAHSLIEEIRKNYPFTLLGKESLRKKIDQLDEPFWIEDPDGNYFIVNRSLAKYAGVKSHLMEGKPARSFQIPVLYSLYESVYNYIKDSGNSVIIKGMPFRESENSGLHETIQYPLFDNEHNFIANVGITQKIIIAEEKPALLLDPLPFAAAQIGIDERISRLNVPFSILMSKEEKDLLFKNYREVLPSGLAAQINDFMESSRTESKSMFSGNFNKDQRISETFSVYLTKLFNKIDEPDGLLMFIEEDSSSNEIETLINRRGRMFDILIQNNPEPVFIYDTENLSFLEVNNAALNLYGYSREEFLHMDFTDLYTPEDIQTLLDSSNTPDKFGKFTGPYQHKTKSGASVFVEISKFEFRFNDKDAHFNIIRDVTEKLEQERKNQLYKSAFDNSQNLLFITDSTGFITYVNNVVLETLYLSRLDVENSSFAALVTDKDRSTISTSFFHPNMKEPVTLNMELKRGDGTLIPVDLTATPIVNYKGEVDSFTILGKVEQEVIEVVKEVIKEVEVERPAEASDKPVTGNIPKKFDDDFLSGMFHEILTPVNVIIGFVQELTENFPDMSKEQKEAADIINQNRTTLLNTMNSIMEFASLGKDNYEFSLSSIGITEIIDYLQKDIEELSAESGIDFSYGKISSSLRFESDKTRFQHLMSLLLRIVAQLTKDKKIYFSAWQSDEHNFVISIRDSYSNVSPFLLDNLKILFGTFDSVNEKDPARTKLTLRLAVKLLRLLNGTFQVLTRDDKLDYGFVFPYSFSRIKTEEPVAAPASESPKPKEAEPFIPKEKPAPRITEDGFEEVPSTRIIVNKYRFDDTEAETPETIKFDEELINLEKEVREYKPARRLDRLDVSALSCLYLEDQVDSQILFKVQMKDLRELKFAVGLEEALPLLDNGEFDFIVVDINLQGEYNGLDALKIIRKMPAYENTPIIAVTAYVLPGDREKFISSGFQDFISKPIFREKMVETLERLFVG